MANSRIIVYAGGQGRQGDGFIGSSQAEQQPSRFVFAPIAVPMLGKLREERSIDLVGQNQTLERSVVNDGWSIMFTAPRDSPVLQQVSRVALHRMQQMPKSNRLNLQSKLPS